MSFWKHRSVMALLGMSQDMFKIKLNLDSLLFSISTDRTTTTVQKTKIG